MCEELNKGSKLACLIPGGVRNFYAVSLFDTAGVSNFDGGVNAITVVGNEVTAFPLKAGKSLYPFFQSLGDAKFGTKSIGERAASALGYEHSGECSVSGHSAAQIGMLRSLVGTKVLVIAEMQDGTYEMFFKSNGAMTQATRDTGQKIGDFNGSKLVFSGEEKDMSMPISSTLFLTRVADTDIV
jgi:hypothetical protein